jgi:hypothetical protein
MAVAEGVPDSPQHGDVLITEFRRALTRSSCSSKNPK